MKKYLLIGAILFTITSFAKNESKFVLKKADINTIIKKKAKTEQTKGRNKCQLLCLIDMVNCEANTFDEHQCRIEYKQCLSACN